MGAMTIGIPGHVVVVGASAAGLATAETLRQEGYEGRITLVGAEPHPPYDRPPLSKQFLAGTWDAERLPLRDSGDYPALGVELRLVARAAGLDPAGRRLLLADGDAVGYDALVVATGVRPRRLPEGHDLAGVHVLRTVDDAAALRDGLAEGPRTVVIGAGFLGSEIAATARALGLPVTLVDPLPAPLYRPFGAVVGGLAAALHADHGVAVRTGVGVAGLVGTGARVTGVALGDGELVPADLVVVAIGSVPATDWLAGSGVPVDDGVRCDARCMAAPGVYAAGDVASWFDVRTRTRVRVEHRTHAAEQGAAVARNLLGGAEPFTPLPYFWTDQYGTRIQAYGVFPAGADVALVAGDPGEGRFTVLYGQRGRVVGALGWNSPRELRGCLRHLVAATPWPDIGDPLPLAAAAPSR
jgi:3-phenylpropionate/trans-cinnamate dioxygenase ferredoxin reductase component